MQIDILKKQLADLLLPLCREQGVDLWGIEPALASPKHKVVRIFIDAPEGVDVDQCATFSRHAEVLLDVEDIIPGRYTLEVSSPGLDRTFFSPDQLGPYLGNQVAFTLHSPRNGRKKFNGKLASCEEGSFTLVLEDGSEHVFRWDEIRKAGLVFRG
ncbi:ribosome maturation factor RimP [Desulfoplanes sp.]